MQKHAWVFSVLNYSCTCIDRTPWQTFTNAFLWEWHQPPNHHVLLIPSSKYLLNLSTILHFHHCTMDYHSPLSFLCWTTAIRSLVSCLYSSPLLQSVLSTEAGVCFLKHKSDHVTSLLKSLQQLSHCLKKMSKFLNTFQKIFHDQVSVRLLNIICLNQTTLSFTLITQP